MNTTLIHTMERKTSKYTAAQQQEAIRQHREAIAKREQERRTCRSTFNCARFALSFDFLTKEERIAVYNAMSDAWQWAWPDIKDNQQQQQ